MIQFGGRLRSVNEGIVDQRANRCRGDQSRIEDVADPLDAGSHPSCEADGQRNQGSTASIDVRRHSGQLQGRGPVARQKVVLTGSSSLEEGDQATHNVADVDPVEAAVDDVGIE